MASILHPARVAVLALLACLAAIPARSEPADRAVATADREAPWQARWIADADAPPHGPGVSHFRKSFDLGNVPPRFPVRVSADNRYQLYVNGVEVADGPARGDLMHWRYESIDIAGHLRPGRNVIAAQVWNMGDLRPFAQVSLRTAFVLQGETAEAAAIDTGVDGGEGWKVFSHQARTFTPVTGEDSGGFYAAGPNESIDAALVPWGWQGAAYDDAGWQAATPVSLPFGWAGALPRGSQPYGAAAQWQLVPRNIPMMERSQQAFAALRRAQGIAVPAGFAAGKTGLIVPAGSRVSLLLDQGALTLGHPVLRTSGGKGARATLTYAESLFDAAGDKGNRDVVAGKTIRGVRDTIRFDGGAGREFSPLWLRAWRYVQLDIETGDDPLRIDRFDSLFTAYPFRQQASFSSDAAWIDPIWEMNWRALRMSAFETFWDTPYYEQLQYVGDTRIEALLSVYQSGDDRLMRNAIEQFDDSRLAEGLTASSYPSGLRQQIPPFSLWWIGMVHDFAMLRDDPAFVKARLPGARAVLDWYEGRVDATGLVGGGPWWNFVDWARDWAPRGVPPGADDGHSAIVTLQLVLALQQAADLEEGSGRPDMAARDRGLADRLVATLRERCWDERRGLFRDSLETASFSQHANVLAILAGAVPAGRERQVMERVLGDAGLTQATFYFRFHVDEALRKAGLADRYLDRLGPWRDMIRLGLTTTPETPDPSRSDSHAWSAHPNYQLLATVLGIRPASGGFTKVEIAPALGGLERAEGRMPHPAGTIAVALKRRGPSGLAATIDLPPGTPGLFRWAGQALALKPGRTGVRCDNQTCSIDAGKR